MHDVRVKKQSEIIVNWVKWKKINQGKWNYNFSQAKKQAKY